MSGPGRGGRGRCRVAVRTSAMAFSSSRSRSASAPASASPSAGGPARPRERRGPREATARYLDNAALYYVGRYASTSENLRRVLMRKVKKSAEAHGTDVKEGAGFVDEIVARFQRSGLVNDADFAASKARKMHERGKSERAIRSRLSAYGLPQQESDAALSSIQEPGKGRGETELDAAWDHARRRKLGPYRGEDARKERRVKDLGVLGRAGFGYEVARRVIDAPEPR